MIVVGAGMAGLVATSILRGQVESVYEQSDSLPNNHSALLRFRSSVVGDAVGIPFRKVRVMKAVDTWMNPVADALSYSMKCTGTAALRSVISGMGEIEERYIAPEDFITRLGSQCESVIRYGKTMSDAIKSGSQIISTIPMPSLMDELGWEDKPAFRFVTGQTFVCDLPDHFDVCATLYFPDVSVDAYRASITGNRLIVEFAGGELSEDVARDGAVTAAYRMGIDWALGRGYIRENGVVNATKYAKIAPIDEAVRKRFILWASEHHGVYSLGRFATWRPGLLLDDVVNDVRVIQRMSAGDMTTRYEASK